MQNQSVEIMNYTISGDRFLCGILFSMATNSSGIPISFKDISTQILK